MPGLIGIEHGHDCLPHWTPRSSALRARHSLRHDDAPAPTATRPGPPAVALHITTSLSSRRTASSWGTLAQVIPSTEVQISGTYPKGEVSHPGVAVPLHSDGYQARSSDDHGSRLLVTGSAEDGFVVGDPRPGDPINGSPHHRIAIASDGHQAGTAGGHVAHVRIAEDGFVVGDPRPGDPINRGPHCGTRIGPSDRNQTGSPRPSHCSYHASGPPKTASSWGTRDHVIPSTDVHTAACGSTSRPTIGSESASTDPTATRPGPPTVTLLISWFCTPPNTASSCGSLDQVTPSTEVHTAASVPTARRPPYPTATRPGPPTVTS